MDSSLIQLEYSDHESKEVIVENWIKMLTNRGILIEDQLNKNIEEAKKSLNSENKDKSIIFSEKKNLSYILIFILRKISTIVKDQDISTYLTTYKDYYKFFILPTLEQTLLPTIDTISTKVEKQLTDMSNIEVFSSAFLMIDRINNIYVPKHILLTDEEADQVVKEYAVKVHMEKIYTTDPIAKYYNAKAGQIFKIIRASNSAGYELAFRHVVSTKTN